MNKILVYLVIIGCIITGNSILFAGTVEHTFYFDTDGLEIIKTSDGYDQIYLKNTLNTAKSGEPSLPYHSVSLLLPPGEKADLIELFPSGSVQIDGNFNIFPQQHSQPVSKGRSGTFVKNNEVYTKDAVYPYDRYGILTTAFLNGHSFALSSFSPVEYNPVTGKLSIYRQIKVKITTSSDQRSQNALKNLREPAEVIKKIKELDQNNGKHISLYSPSLKEKSISDYDYLIVTSEDYKRSFDQLIDFYNGRGLKTQVVSTTAIYTSTTGSDSREQIRNYIIQEYQSRGIEFVLLGGDISVVPARGFFCTVQSSSLYSDSGIPSDLYYSSLDGSWNDNSNNLWGEPGEDDLLPELSVARFSFSDIVELNNMLNKTIKYQSQPVLDELRDPLMVGEGLYSDPITWGSDYLEMLIGYHEENGYTTQGIPEDQNISKIYDKTSYWNKERLIAEMNEGHSFIHHEGHSDYSYNMRMTNDDVTNTNFADMDGNKHNFTIIYSSGCNCGGFDRNCIGEEYISIANCAVAFIGNSRFGWFNEGTTDGPSIHIHREFNDALYRNRTSRLGTAHKESKIDTAPWVNAPGQWEEGALRWCFYDCNVLGDPAMNVWTDEPETITAEFSKIITTGQSEYRVGVKNPLGEPLSKIFCAVTQDGNIFGSSSTDETGIAYIQIDPSISTGEAELVLTGCNILKQSHLITIVPSDGKYIIIDSFKIDSGGDECIEYGETAKISVTLKNAGSIDANGLSMLLNIDNEYIQLTNAFLSIGNINAGDSVVIDNAFTFTVSNSVPDLYDFSLHSKIYDDQEIWSSNFDLTANSPIIDIESIFVDDCGNYILDPGETAPLILSFKNSGHAKAINLKGLLKSDDPRISIKTAEQFIDFISPGEIKSLSYIVQADTKSYSAGYVSGFSAEISSEIGYTYEKFFYQKIGYQMETFSSEDFTAFNWYFEGDAPWVVDRSHLVVVTIYFAHSGNIYDNQSSSLLLKANVLIEGDISFQVRTSAEAYNDPLIFYIDDVEIGRWDQELIAFTLYSFPVTTGEHIFKWSYQKDGSGTSGDDYVWLDNISFPGMIDLAPTSIDAIENIPSVSKLSQNYPNPFNPETTISYTLKKNSRVDLSVYNIKGESVSTLVNGDQKMGTHSVLFNAETFNSGIYLYKLSVDGIVIDSKRMLLIK